MGKVYLVMFNAKCGDGDCDINEVHGAFLSRENAQKCFSNMVKEERAYAEDNNYEVFEDTDTCFDAGEDGYYEEEHTTIRLIEQTLFD